VLAFDTVSGLPAWISDTLCRLATRPCASFTPTYNEVLFRRRPAGDPERIEDIGTRPVPPSRVRPKKRQSAMVSETQTSRPNVLVRDDTPATPNVFYGSRIVVMNVRHKYLIGPARDA
jgi:hypothetical protein